MKGPVGALIITNNILKLKATLKYYPMTEDTKKFTKSFASNTTKLLIFTTVQYVSKIQYNDAILLVKLYTTIENC